MKFPPIVKGLFMMFIIWVILVSIIYIAIPFGYFFINHKRMQSPKRYEAVFEISVELINDMIQNNTEEIRIDGYGNDNEFIKKLDLATKPLKIQYLGARRENNGNHTVFVDISRDYYYIIVFKKGKTVAIYLCNVNGIPLKEAPYDLLIDKEPAEPNNKPDI